MLKRFFRSRTPDGFRTRAPERDAGTDSALIGNVGNAISTALSALEQERDGLNGRISEAHMLASAIVGTGTDEYLAREPAKTVGLASYEADMRRGQERLAALESHISNMRFIRAAFATRFGEHIKIERPKNVQTPDR